MFGQRSTTPAQQPITTAPPSSSSSSLLQSIFNRSTGPALAPDSGYSTPSTSVAGTALGNGPIHPSTNPASFRSLLGSHRAVLAMFTSVTCLPCRMIEPVFEELEWSKGQQQVTFVKVDLGVAMGLMVARVWRCCDADVWLFSWMGRRCVWGFGLDFFMWLMGSVCSLARRLMN